MDARPVTGEAGARMSGPMVMPGGRGLLPEYRWVNIMRHVVLTIGLCVIGAMAIALSLAVRDLPVGLVIVDAIALLVGLPLIVSLNYFRWAFLRRSAQHAVEEMGAVEGLVFSHVALDRVGHPSWDVRGRGWMLLEAAQLSFWKATTMMPRAPAALIDRIGFAEVSAVRRATIAGGRACSRLRIESADGRVFDVALTHPSGRSVTGISDADVDAVVGRIWRACEATL